MTNDASVGDAGLIIVTPPLVANHSLNMNPGFAVSAGSVTVSPCAAGAGFVGGCVGAAPFIGGTTMVVVKVGGG